MALDGDLGRMIGGGRVRVTFEGRTVYATIAAGSDNRRSLMLEFKAGELGGWLGRMPVRADESGRYCDLAGREVAIEWLEQPVEKK